MRFNDTFDTESRGFVRDLNIRQKIGMAVASAAVGVATVGGCQILENLQHPNINVGTKDDDVKELAKLLEKNALTPYEVSSDVDTADETMIGKLIEFQTSGLDVVKDIEDADIGHIRKGDTTWKALEDSKHPKGLPEDCYQDGDTICVVKDNDKPAGTLYVMRSGEQKSKVAHIGIGKPSAPTDNGNFTINPSTMDKLHFSGLDESRGIPMPWAMFFNGGEAIHFSRTLAEKGDDYPGSGGCVTIGKYAVAKGLFEYAQTVTAGGRSVRVVVADK